MTGYRTTSRRAVLAGLGAALAFPAIGGEVYTPARGDPLRKMILDAVRPRIETEMGGRVEFVVRTMNVVGNWAFCVLEPQRPGGKRIRVEETIHAADAEFMDGLTVYALVRHADTGWGLVDSVTGPTDVAYDPWPQIYGAPREIFFH